MNQAEKNTALLNYALSFPDGSYGNTCKIFMNTVVSTVAWKSLPSTMASPNDYKWVSDPNVVVRGSVPPSQFQAGDIVQMKLASGLPHTAMVVGVYYGAPGYINWIDSNSNSFQGSQFVNKVYRHTMSIPDFYTKVGTNYTVYNIK